MSDNSEMHQELLKVEGLKKYFPIKKGFFKQHVGDVKAVDGISFSIKKGETFGLVGESGCGKSTAGRTILHLIEPTAGNVYFEGRQIDEFKGSEKKRLRRKMQIIFQDPYGSLNPRMTVGEAVGEALAAHRIYQGKELKEKVIETITMCGLAPYHINRYPHEFSGGQRQRIGIARALALNPSFVVADEPVSALDVSIQSQILNLMQKLQQQLGFSYLFISHDLSVVKHVSDRVGVMYLGNLVEMADRRKLFRSPMHPYTRALLSAIPEPSVKRKKERIILQGSIPSPANPPQGCKFHTRCPQAQPMCREQVPEFKDYGGNHYVSCHYAKS